MCLHSSHHIQTVTQTAELHEAHPLVVFVLFPLHFLDWASDARAELADLGLHFGVHHRHVENLRGWVTVGWTRHTLAFVLVLFLVLQDLFEDETFVVGIKHFEVRLCVVDLVFCLNGIQ